MSVTICKTESSEALYCIASESLVKLNAERTSRNGIPLRETLTKVT